MEIVQQRPAASDIPVKATLRFFVKSKNNPLDNIKVYLAGKELEGVWVDKDLENVNDWHEIRFKAIDLEPGDYKLKVVASNPKKLFGKNEPITLNFDEFQLRLKEVRK